MSGLAPRGIASDCAVLLPVRVFGGHEKMLLEWLGKAVAQHGLGVQIYCAENERLIEACRPAGCGRAIVSHAARGGSLRDFLATWRLLGRIPQEVPLLFAPGVLQASPLQWVAAFLRRRRVAGYVPMAYSSRQMRFRGGALRDWIVGHLVRRVDLWITISRQQRALLLEHWQVKAPVLVVPNRLALLEQDMPLKRSGVEGPLRVLFAGRFDANQKGLDWLCERLRAQPQRWRGRLRFAFKGQGGFQAELERLAKSLAPHVTVSPWGDLACAMTDADVLLLPSRFEGLPLVALEAIHYGLPVVASREAAVAGFVPSWCLFPFGDDAAMWAALDALRDPARRAAALVHSRRRLQKLLSASAFRKELARAVAVLTRMGCAPAEAL